MERINPISDYITDALARSQPISDAEIRAWLKTMPAPCLSSMLVLRGTTTFTRRVRRIAEEIVL